MDADVRKFIDSTLIDIIENEKPFGEIVGNMYHSPLLEKITVMELHALCEAELLQYMHDAFICENRKDLENTLRLIMIDKEKMNSEIDMMMDNYKIGGCRI